MLSTFGLEALSAAASGETYSQQMPPGSNIEYDPHDHTSQQQHISSAQQLSFILNQSSPDPFSPPIDPRLHTELTNTSPTQTRHVNTASGHSHAPHSTDHDDDIPFLLRNFAEHPGRWMDIFDLGRFFEMIVPEKSSRCPLLLYALVALSAKNIGYLDETVRQGRHGIPNYSAAEWLHKARTFYDLAIHLLVEALAQETRPVSAGSARSIDRHVSAESNGSQEQHRYDLPRTDSDELIGTTAILCVYEFLDASGAEWSRHLDGAKSLFDVARDGLMNVPSASEMQASSPVSRRGSLCRRTRTAVFWCIVRQYMLDACKWLHLISVITPHD